MNTSCSVRRADGSPTEQPSSQRHSWFPIRPGFPVLVPGQVVSKKILYFLAQLDVKEIHGYNPDLGLSVFTQDALKRHERLRGVTNDRVIP